MTSELAINGVRHVPAAQSDWLEVLVDQGDDVLKVSVRGPGKDFARNEGVAEVEEIGGWGLPLVNKGHLHPRHHRPAPTDTVHDAIRMMRARNGRRLPVVEGGKAIGIISLGDILVETAPARSLRTSAWPRRIGRRRPQGSPESGCGRFRS
jgi:hypothetical protein